MSLLLPAAGLLLVLLIIRAGIRRTVRIEHELEAWARREADFRTRKANIEATKAQALRAVDEVAWRAIQALRNQK